ncbi:MAG: 4-hydroxy-tetrahydrodipicolinate reductase [Kiritimatiellia bacterium]
MTNIAILGAAGRMGQALVRCILETDDLWLTGALENEQCPLLDKDAGIMAGAAATGVNLTANFSQAVQDAEVLIDFSFPSATRAHAEMAAQLGKPIVIGTTGLNKDESEVVRQTAARVPVVWAPNMSLGVNLLFALTGKLAGILKDYDIEIVEMHHRHKKDAPSGTALHLAENAAIARGVNMEDTMVHGRHNTCEERPSGQIGMHALRGGDVIGDHTVIFAGAGERLELGHRASRRECFAVGALHAARWVKAHAPGLYNMQDVLGLTPST